MRMNQLIIMVLFGLAGSASAQPAPGAPPAPSPEAPPATLPDAPSQSATTIDMETPAVDTSTTAAKPWKFGVAPRLGVGLPTSKLGATVVGGLELDFAVSSRLLVALDLALTRPSYSSTVMDPRVPSGMASYTIKETEMVVGVNALYRLTAGPKLVPWLGAGPLLHLLKTSETTSSAPGDNTATSTELGVQFAGGIDLAAGPGFVIGDVRVVYSKLAHLFTGDTNAGKVTFGAGYRLVF